MMWKLLRIVMRSRRLGAFLCLLGFVWGVTLINMSLVGSPVTRSSEQLRSEILELSEKYVKQLASESQDTIDGPYAGRLTGYDLKKTMAVLLENVLMRVDRLERQLEQQQNASHLSADRLIENQTPGPPALPGALRPLHGGQLSLLEVGGQPKVEPGPAGPVLQKIPDPLPNPPNKLTAKDLLKGVQENCTLTGEEILQFPHCRAKSEWMKAHWQSDKCYGIHGVDGSQCSFRIYLSEVENWCPLLPGRSRLFFNNTKETISRRATINYDLSGLLLRLKDPVNRQQNYAWIRQRITQSWPGWVENMKKLTEKQNFDNRKQKKVLVHLGLLSKKSGFHIAENSFKGGPLGELLQWSDIISSLYILGHDITITSEVEQLAGILGKLPTAESQCQSREEVPIHMIYIDIVGLTQFKRRVKAGYGKFSCLLRIIDSFGTEPAFNYDPYAKAHKLKTTWGMQNLNPQQFFTMFPHSPDNSFMGFVVEEYLNETESISSVVKKDQAVAYGKAEYMWQGKEEYLAVLHKSLDIHGTVFVDAGATSIIPSYVHNHGILSGPELHRLLRESKVFIGLGFPYEGPAPLEAIAQGCVYINPKFNPPHNSQNTKFFKGKPTLRKVTSQHPYAEEFIGEPHVYTVDVNDHQGLEVAVQQAINNVNQNKVTPYMPYEFTKQGMLQRLNAYIEHQDFCSNKPPSWPPEGAITVVVGDIGKSCKDSCRQRDLICEPSYFQVINTRETIERHVGQKCGAIEEQDDIYFPAFMPGARKCFLQRQQLLFSCVGEQPDLSRICPCRDYIRGQTALCKDCL